MSTDDLMRQQPPRSARAHTEDAEKKTTGPAQVGGTPTAVKDAAAKERAARERMKRLRTQGVDWVRITDLIQRESSKVAGRGIVFNVEQTRSVKTAVAERGKSVAQYVRDLPPLSAFGRRGPVARGPVRSGVGMR